MWRINNEDFRFSLLLFLEKRSLDEEGEEALNFTLFADISEGRRGEEPNDVDSAEDEDEEKSENSEEDKKKTKYKKNRGKGKRKEKEEIEEVELKSATKPKLKKRSSSNSSNRSNSSLNSNSSKSITSHTSRSTLKRGKKDDGPPESLPKRSDEVQTDLVVSLPEFDSDDFLDELSPPLPKISSNHSSFSKSLKIARIHDDSLETDLSNKREKPPKSSKKRKRTEDSSEETDDKNDSDFEVLDVKPSLSSSSKKSKLLLESPSKKKPSSSKESKSKSKINEGQNKGPSLLSYFSNSSASPSNPKQTGRCLSFLSFPFSNFDFLVSLRIPFAKPSLVLYFKG
jgi:hypothetical protein